MLMVLSQAETFVSVSRLYMPYGRFICLALVLTISAVHLFVPKKKDFTKALLLPMLLLYYLASSHEPSWAVIAALIFSWLGDVLLIPNGTKWFVAGGIAFMLSHISFIGAYVGDIVFDRKVVLPAVLLYVVYLAAAALVIGRIKPCTGKLTPALYLYLSVNALMNAFAFMRLLSHPGLPAALTYAGAVLFFISDGTLFIGCFYEKKKHDTFLPVMVTYILGELLITQGLIAT